MIDPRDLYGLPLDRFVPERGALAKALRGEGRRDDAARVAALRKPSVAAWTVNQLVRTQRRAVGAAFDAGDELQRAQADLLAGKGDARTLREAAQRERRAVDDLAEVARGLLSSDGHEPTPATLDRVSETLHAAALEADARAQVQEGCLERELRRAGFGGAVSTAPSTGAGRSRARAPSGTAKRGDEPDRAERSAEPDRGERGAEPDERDRAERDRAERDQAERDQAERDQAERERAERERAEQLASARKAEAAARRVAERAARELEAAQERRDRAAGSLRDAEDALAAARERALDADLAYTRAQEALNRN